MSVDAAVLMSKDGWTPENVLNYCYHNELCDGCFDAYELCETFKSCPIRNFKVVNNNQKYVYFCILSSDCQSLFTKKHLTVDDFSPTLILFEDEAAKSPYVEFENQILYLAPVANDGEFYHELFDEAFIRFLQK